MFKVEVDSLDAYFDFDPARKADLVALDTAIRNAAPNLERHFHAGTPPGEPGMRFKMIGYGQFHYPARSGAKVSWPVIGVALQKNYISVYVSISAGGRPIVETYADRLGALRCGFNNFSFTAFDTLEPKALAALLAQAGSIFASDPENPVRARAAD